MTASPPQARDYRGAYFYPLIVLAEERAAVSFLALVLQDRPWDVRRRSLVSSDNGDIVLHNDGLVLVGHTDAEKALNTLNCVFAAAALLGVPSEAVRLNEIHGYTLDSKTLAIRSSGGPITSLRTTLASPFDGPLTGAREWAGRLTLDEFKCILDTTERLLARPDLASEAVFRLQAHTFHDAHNEAQAFLVAWLLVEKHISRLWDGCLDAKGVIKAGTTKDRRVQMTNPDSWNTHRRLELLNFSGQLDDATFAQMIRFKSLRNKFVHRGEPVPRSVVKELLDFTDVLLAPRMTEIANTRLTPLRDED